MWLNVVMRLECGDKYGDGSLGVVCSDVVFREVLLNDVLCGGVTYWVTGVTAGYDGIRFLRILLVSFYPIFSICSFP